MTGRYNTISSKNLIIKDRTFKYRLERTRKLCTIYHFFNMQVASGSAMPLYLSITVFHRAVRTIYYTSRPVNVHTYSNVGIRVANLCYCKFQSSARCHWEWWTFLPGQGVRESWSRVMAAKFSAPSQKYTVANVYKQLFPLTDLSELFA